MFASFGCAVTMARCSSPAITWPGSSVANRLPVGSRSFGKQRQMNGMEGRFCRRLGRPSGVALSLEPNVERVFQHSRDFDLL
jgi:hypothetical protein